MERLALLRGESYQSNHLLETDVMRFLAIICIVFWIIFALIKSLPFRAAQSETQRSRLKQENESAEATRDPQTGKGTIVVGKSSRSQNAAQSDSSRKRVVQAAQVEGPGVQLVFESLDDLLALVASEKIRIFGRAKATGFDLFFAGFPQGDSVGFNSVSKPPAKLWEIKSSRERGFFLNLMAETYPSIRSFPFKQVLVHFADTDLEDRIERTLSHLQEEGKQGILNVTRNGDVVFQDRPGSAAKPLTD